MVKAARGRRVHRLVASARIGTVVALWKDGTTTTEPFGFHGQLLPDGGRIRPLVTFIAKRMTPLWLS